MLRIVRLYEIVGNLVGKGEIPGGMIRRGSAYLYKSTHQDTKALDN